MERRLCKLVGPIRFSDTLNWSENEVQAFVLAMTLQELNKSYQVKAITAEQYLNLVQETFRNSHLQKELEMENYVVLEIIRDKPARVVGPFSDYELANDYVNRMLTLGYTYLIMPLQKTVVMRMSK